MANILNVALNINMGACVILRAFAGDSKANVPFSDVVFIQE